MRQRLFLLVLVIFALVVSFALLSRATQASAVHMNWKAQAHLIDGDPVDGGGGGG